MDFLYAFGLGLTFIAGMVLGGLLVVRHSRAENGATADRWFDHAARVEDRLDAYAANSAAMVKATREQTEVLQQIAGAMSNSTVDLREIGDV